MESSAEGAGKKIMTGPRLFRLLALGAVALWLLAPAIAHCQIYAGTESATGAVVLSNFRSDEAASVVEGTTPPIAPVPIQAPAIVPRIPAKAATSVVPTAQMRTLVDAAASRNKLSPALIHAVITAESRYDPRAVSTKGAIGLMQLLPATGRRFGAQDLFSAEQNVSAGAGYLRWLMSMFDGDLELVLAAYNAGEQAVINAGCRVPPYPETQAYVKRILASLQGPHGNGARPVRLEGAGCA
jgi:soluble lytic murein transglycosylase-like protein